MRNYQVQALLVAAFLVSVAATSATSAVYAQDMPDIPSMPGFEEISGTYVNEEAGVEVTFPEGWSGVASEIVGFTATVFEGGMEAMQQSEGDFPTVMALAVIDKSEVEDPTSPPSPSEEKSNVKCEQLSAESVTVSGAKGAQIVWSCTDEEGKAYKGKIIMAERETQWVSFSFIGTPEKFDDSIAKFDSSAKTLKIAGLRDLSLSMEDIRKVMDESSGDNDGAMSTDKMMSVTVGGETVNVSIKSASTISNLAVNEESKVLSFKADAAGDTMITVGKVLKGPYTVIVNGQPTEDFQESTDSQGVESISVSHAAGADVSITGTQVVPEFPLVVAGSIIAALIGIVAFAGRTKLFGFRTTGSGSLM